MDHRSPLESIFGVIGSLPHALYKFYNAVAMLLLVLCCAATLGLYMILEPFIKPLMWVFLVGFVLYPLKRSLKNIFQNWSKMLRGTNTPTILRPVLISLNIYEELLKIIHCQLLRKNLKLIKKAGAILIPVAVLLYHFIPGLMVSLLRNSTVWIYSRIYWSFNFVITNSTFTFTLVSIIVLGYVALIFLFWKQENNILFHYASTIVWLNGSCCLASQFTPFQMPIFISLLIMFFGG